MKEADTVYEKFFLKNTERETVPKIIREYWNINVYED